MSTDLHSMDRPAINRRGDDRREDSARGARGKGSAALTYFDFAARLAQQYRDDVLRVRSVQDAPTAVVIPTVIGPDGSRVPCGEVTCPRCVADQFENGRLTITSIDDGYELRVYEPGEWAQCTVYNPDGHIAYHFEGNFR